MYIYNASQTVKSDINEMHWALSFGYLVSTGEAKAPSDERISKMTARDLAHFEAGKRIAHNATTLAKDAV